MVQGIRRSEMGDQINNSKSSVPLVKARLQLGSETFSVETNKGKLSEQLIAIKEQSMSIFKDYITKHNVPNDVPDEAEEISSDADGEISEKPPKSKKRK